MHVMGELFSQQMGLSMVHVPYKGSGPAMTDLISNRVQVMFDAPSSSLPMVTAGKLKALAVTTRRRIAALPQVPSISETLPGFETSLWYGIAVRKSTPPEICALLKSDLDRLLDDPDFRSRLESSGFIMRKAASAKQIETFLAGEEKLWSDIIRTKNIALE
jgi:tripartite-type tricarboxylate transporter receptor subunit TctC